MSVVPRCHWKVKALTPLLHVPGVAVRVRSRVAMPLTVGADTDSGTGRDRIASGTLFAVAL